MKILLSTIFTFIFLSIFAQIDPMKLDLYLDLITIPLSSNPIAIATHKDELIFQVDQYDGSKELWASDGSEGGTKQLLFDEQSITYLNDETISASTNSNLYINYVTFSFDRTELYRYDGVGNVPVLIMSDTDELKTLYPIQNGLIIVLNGGCGNWAKCDKIFYYNETSDTVVQLFDEVAGQSEFKIVDKVDMQNQVVLHVETTLQDIIIFSNPNTNSYQEIYFGEERSVTLHGVVNNHLLFSAITDDFMGLSSTIDGSSIDNLVSFDVEELNRLFWHVNEDRLLFYSESTAISENRSVYTCDGENVEVYLDTQEVLAADVTIIHFFDGELFFRIGPRIFAYDGVNDPYEINYGEPSFQRIYFYDIGNSLVFETDDAVLKHIKGADPQLLIEIKARDLLYPLENSLFITRLEVFTNTETKDFYNINLNTGELEFISEIPTDSEEYFPVELGSKVFYTHNDKEHAIELWSYDLLTDSFDIVKDINVGTSGRHLNSIKSVGNKMFVNTGAWNSFGASIEGLFVFDDDSKELEMIYEKECIIETTGEYLILTDELNSPSIMNIHSTQGLPNDLTLIGTFPITGFTNSNPNSELFRLNDKVLINYDGGLMVSDGTAAGTFNLADISIDREYIIYKDVFYFQANEYAHPNQPDRFWRTDGTVAGTYELFDFQIDNLYIYKDYLLVHNGDRIYFTDGSSDEFDFQWIPDVDHYFSDKDNFYVMRNGVLGTFPFDIPNTIDVNSSNFFEPILNIESFSRGFELNGRAMFYDFYSTLFTTDGTVEGTKLLLEDFHGPFDNNILGEHEGGIYFVHFTEEAGHELWVTDGTEEGTFMIEDLYPGEKGSSPKSMHLFKDELYFLATHPRYARFNREIFVLDNFFTPNLTGIVYDDQNNNGIQDSNELGIPGITVEISPNNQRTTTDEFGNYAFEIERGIKYQIEIINEDCWKYCLNEPIELDALSNPSYQTKYEIDIPACLNGIDKDEFLVDLTSTVPRCNTTGKHWINVMNNSCQRHAGKIEVKFDERDTLGIISTPFDSIGGIYTFEFDVLAQNEVYPIDIVVKRGNEDFTSETLTYQIKTFLLENGEYVALDSIEETQIMRCGFDPNDKQVSPSRVEPSNSNYTQFDELLNYKIRFQNTGNDTSFNVLVTDTLSPLLDPSTFNLIATSHPVTLQSRDNGVLNFYFPDINLVDSLTNEPESHGFISFSIKANEGIKELDEIENTAFIYFDLNKAIVTNTVNNTFVEFLDMDEDGHYFYEECDDTNPNIYPNAEDIPDNGIDEDCDGEDATLFVDSDGDGVTNETDCDDTNSNVYPGAIEICNNIDDNCDGGIDEGLMLITSYIDNDADGFGNPEVLIEDCVIPMGYVSNLDDCDDSNPNIYPGAEEIPGNGIDEDCDGEDLITSTYFLAEHEISVFPNPAKNVVFIKVDGQIEIQATLYDLSSRAIAEFYNPDQISLEDLPIGNLMLKIVSLKSGQSILAKVIKIE